MLSNFPPGVHAKIATHEDVFGHAITPRGLSGESGEGVAVDDQSIHAVFDEDACTFVDSHGRFGFRWSLFLSCADVSIAEGVAGDCVALRGSPHTHGKTMGDGEGVRAQGAAAGVAQVDATFEVMGNHISAQRDAVAIPVEDQRGAIAFLDHVSADHGPIGVLDDDAIAEVVVDVVAVHAEVEGVGAAQGVLVFLEVVRVHHNVVAVEEFDAALFVVGQDTVGNPRVLKAALQLDAVAAMVVDGHAFEVNLLDALGEDAVPALFAAADAQIGQLDTPKAGIFVLVEFGRAEDKGRGTRLVLVNHMSGSPGADDPGVAGFHPQRLRNLENTWWESHQSTGLRDGIEGRLEAGKLRGIHRGGGGSCTQYHGEGEKGEKWLHRHWIRSPR